MQRDMESQIEYKIKPTERQKEAVDKLVENGGSIGKAMREAEYSPATAKTPQKLTESKGYQQLLKDKGLTESLIVNSLVADIKGKPKRRLGELQFGAELIGMKKITQEVEKEQVYIENQNIQIIVQRFEDEFRKELEK